MLLTADGPACQTSLRQSTMMNPLPGATRWADPDRSLPGPPEVHEAVLEAPDGREMRVVAASREALIALAAQVDGYAGHLRPLAEGETPNTRDLDEAISHGVEELQELLRGHDAFDVMTMLRQFMMPPDLAFWNESGSTLCDSWATAEVVALVLLGLGLPRRSPDCDVRTASIVPTLVNNAAAIVQLAAISGMIRWSRDQVQSADNGGMNTLAWRLSSHETSVRGRQYPQVAAAINERVLRTAKTDAVFREVLGFTYDDVLAVRETLMELGGVSFEESVTQLQKAAESGAPPDATAMEAMRALFETPSQLHVVTPERAASPVGLEVAIVKAILDLFSMRPEGRSPGELVKAFSGGRNPMAGKAILHAPERGYLPLPGAMAPDEIRRTCEAPLKGTPCWTRYGRARDHEVETLVSDTIDAILHSRATTYRNPRYRHAASGHDLSSSSTTHQDVPVTEADALILLDGVALCVEVKAGDFRPRARQGGVAQLHGDLDKTVQGAADQADRIRSIIESNGGLWLEDGTWLNLEDVHEIHSIVACLDDLGPLALATSELVHAGVLTQPHLPWVVSVHDLLVFQHVLDQPEHFLTYLRRRTNRDAALWITGSDELDILMWYFAGGFYFEPDPDRLFTQHPKSKPPTAKQRRAYADQGRTLVGTFTDPLDAHYYWEDGTSSRPAGCPRRERMEPPLQRIIDCMSANNTPGWWRAAADIDGYSTQAQRGIADNIGLTLAQSARDGSFHTFTTGGTDDTGRWIYIFAAGPDTVTNRDHLRQYLRAKKHQDHADRALGVLLAHDGKPHFTMWLAHEPEVDPELDALVREMRLIPPDRAPSAVPPKVKKAAKNRRSRKR